MTTERIENNIKLLTNNNKILEKSINELLSLVIDESNYKYKDKFKQIIEKNAEEYFNEQTN